MHTLNAAVAAVLLTISSAGCVRGQDPVQALPDAAERRASAMQVREVARSRDDSLFSRITSVAVDSRGRMYVGDWQAARVVVLDSTGAWVRTVGRKGLGPGEFRSVRSLQILPGDSLVVYDPNAARVSVFPPGAGQPAYVLNVAGTANGGSPFTIERVPGTDAFVALSRPPFTPDATAVRRDEVRVLGLDGTPRGEPLRVFPSKSFVRVEQGGGFSVMPNPFGREGFATAGPDGRVYLAWGDSLAIQSTDVAGRPAGGFMLPFQAGPVEREHVDREVRNLPPRMASVFRAALEDSIPTRWPSIRALLADADGHLWVALGGPAGGQAEWARFDADGSYLGSVFLPVEVEVRAVRGNRIYGVTHDDMDVPYVVAYQLSAQPAGGNG